MNNTELEKAASNISNQTRRLRVIANRMPKHFGDEVNPRLDDIMKNLSVLIGESFDVSQMPVQQGYKSPDEVRELIKKVLERAAEEAKIDYYDWDSSRIDKQSITDIEIDDLI